MPGYVSLFKNQVSIFLGNEFKRGFIYTLSSKALIAFITFLTTPIVARLFSPEEYGTFALQNSAALMLSVFCHLTLPISLVVVDDKRLQKTLTGITNYILGAIFFVFTLGLIATYSAAVHHYILNTTGLNFTLTVCLVMVLYCFLESFSQIFANLNIRHKRFKQNIFVNILDTTTTKASSLLIGFFKHTSNGLFYSELMGKSINVFTQTLNGRLHFAFWDVKKIGSIALTISVLKEHKHFVFYTFPVSILNRFSAQIMLWVFAALFSKLTIGSFTMALSLLSIPLQLIANSLQPIVIKKLDIEKKLMLSGNLLWLVLKIAGMAGFIYLAIFFVSPWFISIYLGNQWIQSVGFVKLLCVPIALQLISNSIEGAFIVYKKQKAQLYFKAVFLLLLIAVIYGFSFSNPTIETVVIIYSTIMALEEISKIIFLILVTRYVGSSKLL
jgi:O-antigen/teichoic acid export membrane protein